MRNILNIRVSQRKKLYYCMFEYVYVPCMNLANEGGGVERIRVHERGREVVLVA